MPKIPRGYTEYQAEQGWTRRGGTKKAPRAVHGKHIQARDKAAKITAEYKSELMRKKAKHGN